MPYKNEFNMKSFFKYIAVAMAMSLLAIGCTPEILAPDQNQLPEASALDVKIDVDQTTNYVTFTVTNPGVVPMWIFGEDKVADGKASKKYAYTQNGLSLRVRDAGTHSVEVKAYNAHGISLGSKIVEYTLENTYRDPFDATPYMKAISGEWQWNNEADKHFGCGPNLADPISWWGAGANEKADWSLYNDHMTFTEDGKYMFDPGEDGKVYVNAGFSALGTSPDGADFLVDIPAYETTYAIENNWNDAGIEEIWLVLPSQKNLSYIPNQTIYDDPRFLFMESKTSAIKKELKLAAAEAPNGDGTISWYYNFIPAVKVATPEELLAGTDGKGKVWILDTEAQGHLGCGDSVGNPAGWWSAGANEKAGTGLYDDEITFFPDGKYVYSSGADGLMYINWGVTVIGPNPGAEPDIDIEWPLTESTYDFDGETITLAPNTPMVYVPSDVVWENPVFHVTSITETSLVVVAENPGCYWQMIFKARDVQGPAGPTLNGTELPAEISVGQGEALEVGNLNLAETWVDPDFFDVNGNTLTFKAVSGDYKFTYDANAKWIKVVPMVDGARANYENGKALWIIGDGGGKPAVGNTVGWNTGDAPLPMAQIAENKYQITLAMKGEGSVKVFGQSDWGLEWTSDLYSSFNGNGLFKLGNGTDGDNGNIYHDGSEAGYYVFTVVDNDGVLDMTVNKLASTVWDAAADRNLWLTANQNNMEFFFATGGDWAGIDPAEYEADGNHYYLTFPEALGALQWQAQVKYKTLGFSTSAAKNYDFQVKVLSEEDHPSITIKLVKEGDDNTFYCADVHSVKGGEEYVYRLDNVPGIDMEDVQLVFDFAGGVGGSSLEYYDIIIQEHYAE